MRTMRLDVPRGLVIVGCVSVGFIISAGPGLVARAAEPAGWSHAIAADASAAAAQIRIAELEQRVRELEGHGGTGSAQASAELTAAMARNEELAARNHALSLENQELARARALAQPATSEPPSLAEPKAQLRYWAQQIRDGETVFGRLSPEWKHAVNVLLRRERQLDPQNPWREP